MERHYRSSSGRSLAHRGYGARVLRQRDDSVFLHGPGTPALRFVYRHHRWISSAGLRVPFAPRKTTGQNFCLGSSSWHTDSLGFWVAFGFASLRSSLVEVSRGVWAGVGLLLFLFSGIAAYLWFGFYRALKMGVSE